MSLVSLLSNTCCLATFNVTIVFLMNRLYKIDETQSAL